MKEKENNLQILLPVRIAMFAVIFSGASIFMNKSLAELSSWWSIIASAVNIVTIFLIVLVAKNSGLTYWKVINYEKGKTNASQIIVMTLIILGVGIAGMYLAGLICYQKIPYAPSVMIAPVPVIFAVVNLLVLPVTTAFAEDGLYLGCGVNQIQNKAVAIIVPGILFALQHSFIPLLIDPLFMLYRFLSFLPLTILLCWNYHKNRNPLPIMIGHAVIDLMTAAQILATSMIPGFYEIMCGM